MALGVTYFSQEQIESSLLFISIGVLIFYEKPPGHTTSNTVSHLCGPLFSLCAKPAFLSLLSSCSYVRSGCKIKSCSCSLQKVSLYLNTQELCSKCGRKKASLCPRGWKNNCKRVIIDPYGTMSRSSYRWSIFKEKRHLK